MEGLVILVALMVLVWVARGRRSEDRAKLEDDGDSHIYYWNEGNELVHESESCNGCMANYADKLRKKGVRVDRVILGRRNSGDLEL